MAIDTAIEPCKELQIYALFMASKIVDLLVQIKPHTQTKSMLNSWHSNTFRHRNYSVLVVLATSLTLSSCDSNPPLQKNSDLVDRDVALALTKPPAKVAFIEAQKVMVRRQKTSQDIPAIEGMGLQISDTIRTQAPGRVQVEFINGVSFRIGGDSVLTIQPQNRLNFTKGDMITWVKPGMKVPTEIVTPVATAAIRGTTAYVEIPKDYASASSQGIRFFSWEGNVAVRLNNSTEEVMLKTGEEVFIKSGATKIPPIRRLSRKEWPQRLQNGRFLRSFTTPLPTQPLIDRLVPGQSSLDEAPPKE